MCSRLQYIVFFDLCNTLCRANHKFGWEAWCRESKFNLENLQFSFRFQLPGASILTLEDPDQLIYLPKLHPWEPKKPLEVKHPNWSSCGNGMCRTGATLILKSWQENMMLSNFGTMEFLPIPCPHGTATVY